MKFALNTREAIKQFKETASDYVKVYFTKKDPNAGWDSRKYALLRRPIIAALSAVDKFPLTEEQRGNAIGFVDGLVIPKFGEVDSYILREARECHRSISSALNRILIAKSTADLSCTIEHSRFEPNWATEVILRNVFDQTSFSFEEKVRIFELFAKDVSEKYILDVANAECRGWGYAHSYADLKKKEYVTGMSFSCNTSLKEWNAKYYDEAVRHIEKFVDQEKSFFSYSSFDWKSVEHIFGDDFDHVCDVIEGLALAKVNNEAEFFRADFRNFCSSMNDILGDHAMRDDDYLFDSKFRLFHVWIRIGDEGAGTKAVSWLKRWV